jgi:hypothetical protein
MRTLLYIHGTGVRGKALAASVELLKSEAAEFIPGWRVEPCGWGEAFGSALQRRGASVHSYPQTGDTSNALRAQQRARWVLLADDPLIELRVAPLERYIGTAPGPGIWARVTQLKGQDSIAAIAESSQVCAWDSFIDELLADAQWRAVIEGLTLQAPAASPLVARALVAAWQVHRRDSEQPTLTVEARDALVEHLQPLLGGPPAAVVDWLLKRLTAYGRDHRGRISDITSPAIGDILRYQARGDPIRNFIGLEAERTDARVILAHSLGGIAALDWLALAPRKVEALITVGSQAAYFYEIDALVSRAYGSGLPKYFPERWLNVFDPSDLLGYPAAGMFPGRVKDEQVDNGQPFPESHGAYFRNRAQFWPAVADFLQEL